MKIKIRGTRGTLPVSGDEYVKYGGNTSCVEVSAGGLLVFFDAGTGITEFLASEYPQTKVYNIFLSHMHYDHIQGLPFFAPLFDGSTEVHIYAGNPAWRFGRGDRQNSAECTGQCDEQISDTRSGQGTEHGDALRRVFERFISPPFLPFTLSNYPARIVFECVGAGGVALSEDVRVDIFELCHPGGSIAYRLTERLPSGRRVFVYATDTSELVGERAAAFADFVRGADLLIYDAFFARDEMLGALDGVDRTDWGHSSYEYASAFAASAGVKALALFHHRERRKDAELDEIEARASSIFDGAFCARDGSVIDI